MSISSEGVEKLLRNLNAKKAAEPDHIPCRFLKELAGEIAPILTYIFSQSLQEGTIPQEGQQGSSGELRPSFPDMCLLQNFGTYNLLSH